MLSEALTEERPQKPGNQRVEWPAGQQVRLHRRFSQSGPNRLGYQTFVLDHNRQCFCAIALSHSARGEA